MPAKITDLDATTSPSDADVFVVEGVTAPGTKKITVASLRTIMGGGDVDGPASATDNAIARFNLTTGKLLQNSAVTIDDSGNVATTGTVDGRDVSVDGAKLDLITVIKDQVAAAPPGVNNDGTQGYAVGSRWINTTDDHVYFCADSSTGAAVWKGVSHQIVDQLSGLGVMLYRGSGSFAVRHDTLDGTSAPTVDHDSDLSYEIGSLFIDATHDHAYLCLDATVGAAVWVQIDGGGGGGSGDVVGPSIASDNAVARFDATTGKLIQGSLFIVDDDGNVTASGLIRGRDIAADGTKLDGVESGADVTDPLNVAAAGAVMDTRDIATTAPLTGGGTLDSDLTIEMPAATASNDGHATAAQITKLDGIESGADVTDPINVKASGALMASELMGAYGGTVRRVSAGVFEVIKNTLNAAAAPGVNDDGTQSYSVGSIVVDTTNGHVYQCVDASTGAAVWLQLDGGGGGGGSGDVVGPASASDGSIAVFDGTDGKTIRDGGVTISAGLVAGRDIGADGTKLDGIESGADVTDPTNVAAAGAVMASVRSVISGGGLTGGGNLTADRTLAVGANGDGSIVVNADDIQVGVINDTQHGTRGGGTTHANAIAGGAAGFLSGSDKTKLDSLAPVAIATLSGTSMTVADSDHQKIYRCTNSSTVTISVPTGLTAGVTVEFIQEGTGQVQFVGTGSPGLTLRYPAAFSPYSRSQWSSVVVTILDTDEAVVRGHLA